jgi:hypothetical protein
MENAAACLTNPSATPSDGRLVHKYLVWLASAATTLNRYPPEILIIFPGSLRTASSHERRWRTFHQILILRAPPGAYFISHYQGGSHGEWPKDRHEHAPTKTGGVICCPPKAVDTE